jgi:hypothetical protein
MGRILGTRNITPDGVRVKEKLPQATRAVIFESGAKNRGSKA